MICRPPFVITALAVLAVAPLAAQTPTAFDSSHFTGLTWREVGPARGGGALQTTRAGLSAIFYGGLSVSDAIALGLAEANASIASRVDAIANLPALAPIDRF